MASFGKKISRLEFKNSGFWRGRREFKNLAKALDIEDSVNFTPRTNDVSFYYESSSIYCLPSQTEGLPLVVIEAMAFGLPIVAFNCSPGVKQLVEHKENGFLCEKIILKKWLKV